MVKAVINIKTDKEVKANVQRLAEELGISLSDIINASLRNFIRLREVRISSIPQMTLELEKLLGPIERDIRENKKLSSGFSLPETMGKYLNSL